MTGIALDWQRGGFRNESAAGQNALMIYKLINFLNYAHSAVRFPFSGVAWLNVGARIERNPSLR
jgi:hypothetical protein